MMAQYDAFSGVYSLLLTPFRWDRTIDEAVYEEYVAWQAAFRPQHLFAVCGSSEMTELTRDERIRCAGLAVKNADGVPVFVTGNLEPTFEAQVEEIRALEQQGVSGLVFVTRGMCDRPTEMYEYLMDLASRTELPLLLYEFPGMQPHLMDAETYGRLAASGRFRGIKDCTSNLPGIEGKIVRQGASNVLQANIPYLYDAWLEGARGVFATPTTCGADLFVQMWAAFSSGDRETARKVHQQIILLDQAIDSGFCASAKYLCRLRGVPMQWFTRGKQKLSPARLRSLEVFYDYAKETGIFKDA